MSDFIKTLNDKEYSGADRLCVRLYGETKLAHCLGGAMKWALDAIEGIETNDLPDGSMPLTAMEENDG